MITVEYRRVQSGITLNLFLSIQAVNSTFAACRNLKPVLHQEQISSEANDVKSDFFPEPLRQW
jgi:hypothetical protein